MSGNIYIYIFVAWFVSYLIRVLPLTLIRKPIENQFIRSFLYYVPYVTLSVMTFPAIVEASASPVAGLVSLVAGVVLAFLGAGLFPVAIACCLVVFAAQYVLNLF
ncbi:AzlD domain-containing protein [uncultured Treponema sp.]|uniref:AzlD domain-containing protein n=1 Tax=uncultured Treponema sp. TaxID=162155 RepID=UPI0025EB2490|nr:AzlD domain-containing protein [uncultured Treponema sp.]